MQPIARLNMFPFKYPSDFELFKNALDNTWTPFQVPMGTDKEQFATVDANIKHIAITNLANLTTSDVEIMDNCSLGLQHALLRWNMLNAPETRMFMNMQAYQEAVHTMSYQHIIESLGLTLTEQKEFYNMWQDIPQIRKKVDFAAKVTRRLMSDKLSAAELFKYCFFYWLLYEGGWFFGGFNVNFAINHFYRSGDKPLFSGTAEQLEYIFRDETLHIQFGKDIINRFPEDFKKEAYTDFEDMALEIIDLEADYADYLLDKPILGYNAKVHTEFLKYIIGVRFNSIGLESPCEINSDPPQWRTHYTTKKEKNFFEKHVAEYRTGTQLNWD